MGFNTWLLTLGATIILNEPIYLHTGPTFCHITYYHSVLGVIQVYSGGVGIALMRMLFIQFPTRMPLEQKATSIVIGVATTALTFGASYLWVISPKKSTDLTTLCFGRSLEFHRSGQNRNLFLFAFKNNLFALRVNETSLWKKLFSFIPSSNSFVSDP